MTEPNNRRRFQRIILNRPVSLVIEGRTYPGELIDISLRGILIRIDGYDPPAQGSRGVVDIALDEDPEFMIRMQVNVCHLRDELAGLAVTGLELDDAATLKRLVELNIGDAGILQRELEELASPEGP